MRNDVHKQNIQAIVEVAKRLGIDTIRVDFDGGGDEGTLNDAEFFNVDGDNAEFEDVLIEVQSMRSIYDSESGKFRDEIAPQLLNFKKAVNEVVEAMVSDTKVNWYEGEGGFGYWILTVSTGELDFNIELRFLESESRYNYFGDINEIDA